MNIVIVGGSEGIDAIYADNKKIDIDVIWYNDFMTWEEREEANEAVKELEEDAKWFDVY